MDKKQLGMALAAIGLLVWRRGNGYGNPIPGAVVNSGWGEPRTYRNGVHEGLDFLANIGTQVYAIADGTVTIAHPYADNNAGKYIAIQHADGITSSYMHLSQLSMQKGQQVSKGQLVGLSGNTANPVFTASAPHLHLSINVKQEYLAAWTAKYGSPAGGFGSSYGTGVGVPAEAIIPISTYTASVKSRAATKNIKLASGGLTSYAGLGLVGYGLYQLRS